MLDLIKVQYLKIVGNIRNYKFEANTLKIYNKNAIAEWNVRTIDLNIT